MVRKPKFDDPFHAELRQRVKDSRLRRKGKPSRLSGLIDRRTYRKNMILAVALTVILCIAGAGVYVKAQSSLSTFYIMGGVYPGAPTYTVWKEGSTYYAKDAYGQLDYSSTNASYILNTVAHVQVAASEDTTGNYILVANAEYSLDAPLLLNVWHTRLVGYGNDAPVFTAAASLNDDVIRVSNYSITIQNIKIDGNKASQTSGNGINITSTATINRAYILECSIFNCKENGIAIVGPGGTTQEAINIETCSIWGNDEDGIHLGGSAWDWKIAYCTIASNTLDGIHISTGGEGAIIGNNIYENDQHNIFAFTTWGVQISANHILDAWYDGLRIEDSDWLAVTGNTVQGNDDSDSGYVAIRLENSDNCTITGNIATNMIGQTQYAGIYESATSGNNIIVANVCSGTSTGIRVLGSGSIVQHNSNMTQS